MDHEDSLRRPFRPSKPNESKGSLPNEKGLNKETQVTVIERGGDAPSQEAAVKVSTYLRHLPWASFLELFLVILTILGAAVLIACINGKEEWPTHFSVGGHEVALITPAVILSIAHSIIAFLVGLAVKDGISVAWWRKAFRGETVRAIDKNYKFATSLKEAALSGTRINVIAIATIGAAIAALAQGPLMQRALTIYLDNNVSKIRMTSQVAPKIPVGFTAFGSGTAFSPNFNRVVKEYQQNSPLDPKLHGCNGTCRASVSAAGFAPSCDDGKTEEFHPEIQLGDYQHSLNHSLFSIEFELGGKNKHFHQQQENTVKYWTFLKLITRFSTTAPVRQNSHGQYIWSGQTTTRRCDLHPALVEYPVIITNVSSQPLSIVLDPTISPINYTIISTHLAVEAGKVGRSKTDMYTNGGFVEALNMIYESGNKSMITFAGLFNPAFTLQIEKPSDMSYLNMSISGFEDFSNSGALQILDPTEDMIRATTNLAFRAAIQATEESDPVTVMSATQKAPVNRYKANYAYLAASVAVTVVGVALILPTFWGWWQLNRKVSLNPIEIAEAFNAPALRNHQGYENTDELLETVGDRSVKYAPVDIDNQHAGVANGRRQWKMEIIDTPSR